MLDTVVAAGVMQLVPLCRQRCNEGQIRRDVTSRTAAGEQDAGHQRASRRASRSRTKGMVMRR